MSQRQIPTQFELLRFPLVVEPAVDCIEVELCRTADGKRYWCQFQRVSLRWNLPIPLDNRTPHVFGNSRRFYRCTYFLAFDCAGRLSMTGFRDSIGWNCDRIPEEVSGAVRMMPSLRLTFDFDEERELFLRIAHDLASEAGPQHSTFIRRILDRATAIVVANRH